MRKKSLVKTLMLSTVFAVLMAGSATTPAHADWDHHGWQGGGGWHDDHFRGFRDEEWRGGHWFHGIHEGRPGWWWSVRGRWFYHDAPEYPYPVNPYAPRVVYAPPVIAAPPPPPPGINLIVPLNIR
jgi:hypothetical protein